MIYKVNYKVQSW